MLTVLLVISHMMSTVSSLAIVLINVCRVCLHYTYSCLYYVPCTVCTRLHYLFGGIECYIRYKKSQSEIAKFMKSQTVKEEEFYNYKLMPLFSSFKKHIRRQNFCPLFTYEQGRKKNLHLQIFAKFRFFANLEK